MTHRVGRVGIGRARVAEIEVWEEAIAEEGRKLIMGYVWDCLGGRETRPVKVFCSQARPLSCVKTVSLCFCTFDIDP